MLRVPLLLIALIILSATKQILADDGGVDVQSGSAVLMQEHRHISMSDEYVLIEMMPEKYHVTARFNFYNSGPSTTVAVGFPVSGKFDFGTGFINFKTWVNNTQVQTKDYPEKLPTPCETGDEWYHFFKVKEVFFPAKSTTTTFVEYAAKYGDTVGGQGWANYTYGTGKSWKGAIGKAVFDIRFNESLLGLDIQISNPAAQTHRASGQLVLSLNNIDPIESANLRITFQDWSICSAKYNDPEYAKDFCSALLNPTTRRPDYPTLTVLRLQRNAIFARHGRIFKDKVLKDFFTFLKDYSPQAYYKESDLSAEEKEQAGKILLTEERIASTKILKLPFSAPK